MKVISRLSYVHRRKITALAFLAAAAAGAYGSTVFDRAQPFGFSDPDSESSRAYELLEDRTGEQAVPGVLLLVAPQQPPGTPAGQAELTAIATDLEAIEGIARAPAPEGASQAVSADGRLALVRGYLDSSVDDPAEVGERASGAFAERRGIRVGGPATAAVQLNETTEEDLRRIELYAAPFLLLVSLLVFRGLVAAMLPLIVGGLSIAFTLAALRALSEVMVIDIFALNVVTVLGLGLAIDYSLFMVSRHREELARSGPGAVALAGALAPVGRMVCFSAATVSVAMASLAVFPQPFLYSAGIGSAIVALVSAAVVLTVLPAILGTLGERVNSLRIPAVRKRPAGAGLWPRTVRAVRNRPAFVAIGAALLMVAVGTPFLRAELTRADARVLPADNSARVVDETVRKRFREDPAASLTVVLPAGERPGAVRRATRGLRRLEGVVAGGPVAGPPGLRVILARTRSPVYSDEALELVADARALDWGAEALITGTSAELVDQRESLSDHLPSAVGIVVVATIVALLLMTGSVVVPLLTVVANTLTISFALGVLVWIFQDGRYESLLGYSGVGALDISVPILLFAVVFGLSTDYGVFLLSRIGEVRDAGTPSAEAIAVGLERTGRVITAAALLFAVAMGSFAFSQMVFIKEVAVGTSVAVLVDATLVRALLLPALLYLCGRWAWWAPVSVGRWGRIRA